MRFFRFLILLFLKVSCHILYKTQIKLINSKKIPWKNIKLIVLLNHTSLFEFIFITILPVKYLWTLSKDLVMPVADITYDRFFVGNFLKQLAPHVVRISRKRDNTWSDFLNKIDTNILIFPAEGRMRRRGGLDKDGKPLSVRGGLVDVLPKYIKDKFLIVYSHGLHHVHAPGDRFPKLFKRISASLEVVNVANYCKNFKIDEDILNKAAIQCDLDHRRDKVLNALA